MRVVSTKVMQELQSCLELLGFSSEIRSSEMMVINGNGLETVGFNYREEQPFSYNTAHQDVNIDIREDSFRIIFSKKVEGVGTITNRIRRYGIGGNITIDDFTDEALNNISIESIIEDKDGQKCHVRYQVSPIHYSVFCEIMDKNNNKESQEVCFRNAPSVMKRANGAIYESERNSIAYNKHILRLELETLRKNSCSEDALHQIGFIKIDDRLLKKINLVDYFAIKMGLMAHSVNVKLIKNVLDMLRLTYPQGEFDKYIDNSTIASLTNSKQVAFDIDNHFLYGDINYRIYEYMKEMSGENIQPLDPVGHVKRLGVMQQ